MSTTKTISAQDMVAAIGKRIEMLQAVQATILQAYGTEPVTKAEAKPAKAVKKGIYGQTRALVRTVLANSLEPLSASEVLKHVQKKGWQTTSNKPLNPVRMALQALLHKGEVQKVGADWEMLKASEQGEEGAAE